MYDHVVQHFDNGEHTVSIDPIRNNPWIYAGAQDKHHEHVHATHDRNTTFLQRTINSLANTQPHDEAVEFTPTAEQLDAMPNFASRPFEHERWRGALPRRGMMPAINQLHRDGALLDMPKHYLAKMAYENRKTVELKAITRAGAPDHGLASYDYR